MVMYTVVTSFNKEGYDKYAKTFLEAYKDKWPSDVYLMAYYHDMEVPEDAPKADNIGYFNLHETSDHDNWFKSFGSLNGVSPEGNYNYRVDAQKFAHKVFAIVDAARLLKKDSTLIWLDADTETLKEVTIEDLQEWAPDDVVISHLGRTSIDYSETSFLSIKLNTLGVYFIGDLKGTYLSGEMFRYQEWHDGYIFTRLLNYHAAHGLSVKNLSEGVEGLEAFQFSPLGRKMEHYKGARKDKVQNTANRYEMLMGLVRHYRPSVICETGTWRGERAVQIGFHALQYTDHVHYIGFDLFEEGTEELDVTELNAKSRQTVEGVSAELERFAKTAEEHGKKFTYELHKGNTNITMAGVDLSGVDFAFIDGGHSVGTTHNDYEYLKHVPVIVLDDYFTPDSRGGIPAPEYCGTNHLWDNTLADAPRKFILPSKDGVREGGITHLAVLLTTDESFDPPQFGIAPKGDGGGFKIQPKDSRPKEYIAENIKYALSKIKKWVPQCEVAGREVLICSAGPSLKNHLEELKRKQKEGALILCVKHSLPILVGAGIKPWGCVILDPRPFNEESTHGKVRSSLVDRAPKSTKFFVASMTDKAMVDFLVDNHYDVWGWHAWNSAVKLVPELEGTDHFFVQGGTCSAMRSVGLMYTMGFRRFILYGFDSCMDGKPDDVDAQDDKGNPKYFVAEVNGKKFYTTGELVAQAQDAEQLFDKQGVDVYIEVKPSGIIYEMWKGKVLPTIKQEFADTVGA